MRRIDRMSDETPMPPLTEVKVLISSLIKDLVKSGEWKGLLVGTSSRHS
jgi:hypothetical protein